MNEPIVEAISTQRWWNTAEGWYPPESGFYVVRRRLLSGNHSATTYDARYEADCDGGSWSIGGVVINDVVSWRSPPSGPTPGARFLARRPLDAPEPAEAACDVDSSDVSLPLLRLRNLAAGAPPGLAEDDRQAVVWLLARYQQMATAALTAAEILDCVPPGDWDAETGATLGRAFRVALDAGTPPELPILATLPDLMEGAILTMKQRNLSDRLWQKFRDRFGVGEETARHVLTAFGHDPEHFSGREAHSMSHRPCAACGDLEGCHLPARERAAGTPHDGIAESLLTE